MTYTLKSEIHNDYLHAVIIGLDTSKSGMEYWPQVTEMLQSYKLEKLLMEEHLIGSYSNEEISDWVNLLIKMLPFKFKMAFYCLPTRLEEYMYFRDLMLEKGFEVNVFTKGPEAIKWLLEA